MTKQEDRQISSNGTTISRWMKSKMNEKFDLEQTAALSPPEQNENFVFYYQNYRSNNNQSDNSSSSRPVNANSGGTQLNDHQKPIVFVQNIDKKHTLECQKFLNDKTHDAGREPQLMAHPIPTAKLKSSGVDDGFKGEAAKCGTSVLRVAHQMIASGHLFGTNNEQPTAEQLATRRGSRSLPNSPLNSPKLSVKNPTNEQSTTVQPRRHINKYFTGAFTDIDQKQHGNWMLPSLLLAKREQISYSSQSLPIKGSSGTNNSSSAVSDNESVDSNSHDNNGAARNKKKTMSYVMHPAEYREMNILSPTSM